MCLSPSTGSRNYSAISAFLPFSSLSFSFKDSKILLLHFQISKIQNLHIHTHPSLETEIQSSPNTNTQIKTLNNSQLSNPLLIKLCPAQSKPVPHVAISLPLPLLLLHCETRDMHHQLDTHISIGFLIILDI